MDIRPCEYERRVVNTQQQEEEETVAKIYTVVIDPGCGGTDSGNPGMGDTVEKTINLQVALKLQAMLEAKYPDVQVVMTRSDDSTLDTDQRGVDHQYVERGSGDQSAL